MPDFPWQFFSKIPHHSVTFFFRSTEFKNLKVSVFKNSRREIKMKTGNHSDMHRNKSVNI